MAVLEVLLISIVSVILSVILTFVVYFFVDMFRRRRERKTVDRIEKLDEQHRKEAYKDATDLSITEKEVKEHERTKRTKSRNIAELRDLEARKRESEDGNPGNGNGEAKGSRTLPGKPKPSTGSSNKKPRQDMGSADGTDEEDGIFD